MPGPRGGYLAISDTEGRPIEIINQARTAAYLSNPDITIDGIEICSILDFGGCQQDALIPDDEECTTWSHEDYDKPTEAPWFNANYPESADFLGFYIEDWTGLGDGHIQRGVTDVQFGVQLGPARAGGRVMLLTITAFAATEEAMEYGFRWLSKTLSGVCSTCSTNSIYFRRFCDHDADDPMVGIGQLRKVGLTVGVNWEAEIGQRGDCHIRRLSFTLTAADPCVYVPGTDLDLDEENHAESDLAQCLEDMWTENRVRTTRVPCRPSCSELLSDCREVITFDTDFLGAGAPIVTLHNDDPEFSVPLRMIVYSDPLEVGIDPNPCGLHVLGEVYVRPLPPSAFLRWDVVGREILYNDPTTAGFQPSWAFIDPNDLPIQRFFALPCGQAHLVIEPANLCMDSDDGEEFTFQELEFLAPHFPTVSVELAERHGCV